MRQTAGSRVENYRDRSGAHPRRCKRYPNFVKPIRLRSHPNTASESKMTRAYDFVLPAILGLRSEAEEFKQQDRLPPLDFAAKRRSSSSKIAFHPWTSQRSGGVQAARSPSLFSVLCSLFPLHPSLPPFPLFEVNAARRLRANLNIAVTSEFIGMYEHFKRH